MTTLKKPFFNNVLLAPNAKPLFLLASVSAYVFIVPLFNASLTNPLSFILTLTILAQSAFVLGEGRKKFLVTVILVWIIQVASAFANMTILNYVSKFTTNLFFIYMVFRLIGKIMNTKKVSGTTILEAINGYLLMGIAYSGFMGFVVYVNPAAFNPEIVSLNEIKYFTFVTFTTLGYGDILPISQGAKSLSLIISISGQFYVGIIIAILIGKYSSRPR